MKPSLLIIGVTMLGNIASANIIANNSSITGSGVFTWTYDMQLSSDQNANSGLVPSGNPVPHTNLTFGAFVTIYDFAGYVVGSCAAPSGWTCTTQNVGYTPDDVIPIDNPNITNITWTYTSGPIINGQPNGIDLGAFSAKSIYVLPTQTSYASRGIKNLGPQIGTISDNVGTTQGPNSVPEPTSALAVGSGMIALAVLTRRFGNGA
jgi:hypothetical protein